MAINYTRRIPRQDNVQRGQAATALANSYNIAAGRQPDAQSDAPMSEYDKERARIYNRLRAPQHDDSNAWVQSANRGRAAIDSGNAMKPTPAVGSRDFATRTLPSGTPNAPINYETIGDTINPTGIQKMREAGGYSEDELANPGKIPMNYGMYQYLDSIGGLDHVQAQYEAYDREKRRKQMEYEMAMRQNYGPVAAQDAMALGVPDDSGSTGANSYDPYNSSLPDYGRTGSQNSVADFSQLDNDSMHGSPTDYYQLDSQGYNDAPQPYYGKGSDEAIAYINSLRDQLEAYRERLHNS